MPGVALAIWSLFVWGVRVRNAMSDSAWGSVVLAGTFVVLAVVVLVGFVRREAWLSRAVLALAVWTTGVWLWRGTVIWFRDHAVGFKLVHTVLAVGSIALAGWAVQRMVPRRASGRRRSARA